MASSLLLLLSLSLFLGLLTPTAANRNEFRSFCRARGGPLLTVIPQAERVTAVGSSEKGKSYTESIVASKQPCRSREAFTSLLTPDAGRLAFPFVLVPVPVPDVAIDVAVAVAIVLSEFLIERSAVFADVAGGSSDAVVLGDGGAAGGAADDDESDMIL